MSKRVVMVLWDGNVIFPYQGRCVGCGGRQSAFRACGCWLN